MSKIEIEYEKREDLKKLLQRLMSFVDSGKGIPGKLGKVDLESKPNLQKWFSELRLGARKDKEAFQEELKTQIQHAYNELLGAGNVKIIEIDDEIFHPAGIWFLAKPVNLAIGSGGSNIKRVRQKLSLPLEPLH